MMRRALLVAWTAVCAYAHVGSPDVFLEGSAGPYPMYVTIRPPSVIPGVAEIEIRCASPDIQAIHVTPTPLTGAAAKFAPTPDTMQRSKADAQFFTGTLWMMAPGSWQVRIQADGGKGAGQLSVPVPAVATSAKPMQFALGVTLFVMMIVLAVGLVSIVGAGVREGQLEPGMQATTRSKRRARILMGATAALVILILWTGDRWWASEASDFAGDLYRPLQMTASIVKTSMAPQDRLVLTLANPAWSVPRKIDDFLPDHGHLMHLYVIRQPDAARVWHLHPEMTASGVFTLALPPMPAGQYQLYGDVVPGMAWRRPWSRALAFRKTWPGLPSMATMPLASAANRRMARTSYGIAIRCHPKPTRQAFSSSAWSIGTAHQSRMLNCTWECWAMRRS
jgi:hypothetical protein